MKNEMNRYVCKQLKKIYIDPNIKLDFMGYKLDEDNHPTYHHIVKATDLRNMNESYEATLENGALLGKRSHEFLHRIEQNDLELYLAWNKMFLLINKSHTFINEELWNMIFELKTRSEELYFSKNKSR